MLFAENSAAKTLQAHGQTRTDDNDFADRSLDLLGIHEQVPTIAAAVHDSLLWTSYGGIGDTRTRTGIFCT